MSLRGRLTILCAIAVAATVVLITTMSYIAVRNHLRSQVDESVTANATRLAQLPNPEIALPYFRLPAGTNGTYLRVTKADRSSQVPDGQPVAIPRRRVDTSIARGDRGLRLRDAHVAGQHLRVASAPARSGTSVQFAQRVDSVDATIADLRTTLLLIGGGSVVVSAIVALLVAHLSLRPVAKLTRAAERVTTTQDLAATLEIRRRDEVGRLASSFNAMLTALDRSRTQQRELVRDAGHELLTPLTSLRTNIEVLARAAELQEPERQRVLDDVAQQVSELATLVDDLVELAADAESSSEPVVEIDLDRLVVAAVDRARLRAPNLAFDVEVEPTRVQGRQRQLERALINLLDNACKWSPPGERVEVRQHAGTVTIRDHGVGIAPEDLPRVFDRFYRAPAARSMPGSGLGLAIVHRVVEGHGGSVTVEDAHGGGVVARVALPVADHEAAIIS